MADVGGVADLAHLAVADDIEPGVVLPTNDLVHGLLQQVIEQSSVVLVTAILREQHVDNLPRSRKAADVCGEDAIGGHLEIYD